MKIHTNPLYSFHQLGGRGNQEDNRYPDIDQKDDAGCCFAVCDGVGGNAGGEFASQTVCETIGQIMQDFDGQQEEFTVADFRQVLDAAYNALDQMEKQNSDLDEMSTTLTFVCLHTGGALVAHIGDSRIYHIRPGIGILYRSVDHSYVNALVHEGEITPEQAIDHPKSNYITRCMSPVSDKNDRIRDCASVLQISDIRAGDYFLLCTDGVLHCANDETLVRLLESDRTDNEKIETLATLCKNSSDNNTAILVSIDSVEDNQLEPDVAVPSSQTSTRRIEKGQQQPVIVEVESIRPKRDSFLSRLWQKIF